MELLLAVALFAVPLDGTYHANHRNIDSGGPAVFVVKITLDRMTYRTTWYRDGAPCAHGTLSFMAIDGMYRETWSDAKTPGKAATAIWLWHPGWFQTPWGRFVKSRR